VHRGHSIIIAELKRLATAHDARAVVFTFAPHPVRILKPEAAPPPLTWIDRKAELLAEQGVDAVIAYPTDRELLSLGYREFFQQIVVQQINACAMVEGPNFYFGKGREGDPAKLQELCSEHSIELTILEPAVRGDEFISSSRIRNLIRDGDVDQAREPMSVQSIRLFQPEAFMPGKLGFMGEVIGRQFTSVRIQPLESTFPKLKYTCWTSTERCTACRSRLILLVTFGIFANSHRRTS
jgi:hypothetical protein